MRRVVWSMTLAPLLVEAGYRVITFDHRGSGDSAAPPAPYTIADLAADVEGLIEHLGIAPCRLVGFSLGGFVAQQLAVSRPDMVRAVALLASAGPMTAFGRFIMESGADLSRDDRDLPESAAIIEALAELLPPTQLQDDDVVTAQIERLRARPPWTNPGRLGTFEATLSFVNAGTGKDLWPRIACPVLAIGFGQDVCISPRGARLAVSAMKDAEFVEIPGAGHGGPMTHAPAVAEHLLRFFSRT